MMPLAGDRIRALREYHTLSQSALGRMVGKDAKYISKLERGVLTTITTDTLEALARYLRCTTDFLLYHLPLTPTPVERAGVLRQTLEQRYIPQLTASVQSLHRLLQCTPHTYAPNEIARVTVLVERDIRAVVRLLSRTHPRLYEVVRALYEEHHLEGTPIPSLRAALRQLRRLIHGSRHAYNAAFLAQAVPHIEHTAEALLHTLRQPSL